MTSRQKFPKHWVFIRGLTRSRFHWLGFDQQFKKHFSSDSVFCTELNGCGYLHNQESPNSLNEAVQQLQKQFDEFKIENKISNHEPIGLLGISMGGMIASRWCEFKPSQVSHLVLVNTSFSSYSSFYHRLKPNNYIKLLKNIIKNSPAETEKFIYCTTSNDESKWKNSFNEIIEFRKSHPISFKNFIKQLQLSNQAQFKYKPIPNVLVLNSLHDRLVNANCSQQISKAWHCNLKTHPTAGHDLPLDDSPWILNQIQNEFITTF